MWRLCCCVRVVCAQRHGLESGAYVHSSGGYTRQHAECVTSFCSLNTSLVTEKHGELKNTLFGRVSPDYTFYVGNSIRSRRDILSKERVIKQGQAFIYEQCLCGDTILPS